MRQIVEVINERTSLADYRQRTYVEWQTKTLAKFLAGLSQSKDGSKEMSKAADTLSIFSDDRSEDDSEHAQSKVKKNEPKAGSFEKLSMLFGHPGTVRPG